MTIGSLLVAGCSGVTTNSSTSTDSTTPTGASFVVGTDAPMASVTSFSVVVSSIQAFTTNDCSGTGVSLVSGTPTVDFARFNGLQTLLDMNDVAVGTYNCVSISLGSATLGYLDTSGGGAPVIATEAATLPSAALTYPLSTPMIVATAGAPVGLHMDFNLRKSIVVDSNGNITGAVNPTFNVKAVNNQDPGAYIDEFDAAVLTTTAQSFTIQGPHGRQFTVNVSGSTEWDGGASLGGLTSSSIVQVSGFLDRADATIDADEVAVLSDSGFYAAGQLTYVTPSSGPATSFDLYVRGTLPASTGVVDGDIATINLSGSEKFSIYWMHGPLAQFLFNPSGLLPGQHIAVGGPATGATSASNVTVKRVMLRDWGFNGTVVAGSENSTTGSFQMQVNGFAGVLIPQTVTVYLADNCSFRDGWTGFSNITDGANVRVVGLLLKDPTSGNTVLVGHYVDDLD
ncbi:MAG TPA: DUF4382 domain-containing protein [Terracidiphilus sp.]|jgi:hypothetical protein|nr:DUF4382 domain-containing protein [Terracidiphilus sp.]